MKMAEKDGTEGRCPACCTPYDKEKFVGMASICERLVAEVSVDRKKSQTARSKPCKVRQLLGSVRVIQWNVVHNVGLPLTMADEDLLQRKDYFGLYGRFQRFLCRRLLLVLYYSSKTVHAVYILHTQKRKKQLVVFSPSMDLFWIGKS